MKAISTLGAALVMTLVTASSARATTILDVSSALTLTDPIQVGRLSRNGLPQDWSHGEAFPGVINTTTAYHYHAFLVNVGITQFVQIEADSASVNTFVAAYDTSYLPNSAGSPNFGFNVNWLGDAGFSGNLFPGDPAFFQVLVPWNHNLLIVINNSGAGNLGVGDPFHLLVEGFIDTEFTDPPPVPEPATIVLGASGLALITLRSRVRRRRSARAR
jgi:hypothetical protein